MHHLERFRHWLEESPLIPAPMCNYTDRPFRDLLRGMGARLVYTEMYSSEALARGDPKTASLMDYPGEEPPVVVQLFGSRPDLLAESVRIVERLGAHGVDLNLGCPVRKITKAGCGAALAENPAKVRDIVRAMRQATDRPFSVKMRWQPGGKALELARMCEAEGADAVALHARTRAQGYSGRADWRWIARMKESLSIPLIGNGDVRTVEDAERMRAETGCDAVMVGRGIVGNPWLMRSAMQGATEADRARPKKRRRRQATSDEMEEGPDVAEASADAESGVWCSASVLPPREERLPVLFEHARLMHLHRGARGLIEFRKHCVAYIRGLPGARAARPELMQATTLEELHEILTRRFGAFDA